VRIAQMVGGIPLINVAEKCRVRIQSDSLTEASLRNWMSGIAHLTAEKTEEGYEIIADKASSNQPGNAIADIIEWLANLPYKTDADPMVAFLYEKIGHETNGASLGISRSDEVSGSTQVYLKLIVKEGGLVTALFNVRY